MFVARKQSGSRNRFRAFETGGAVLSSASGPMAELPGVEGRSADRIRNEYEQIFIGGL